MLASRFASSAADLETSSEVATQILRTSEGIYSLAAFGVSLAQPRAGAIMPFRVEDLTISLLPEGYEIENAKECTKCTKCTARTGDPTACSDPSEQGCACCQKNSPGATPRKQSELDAAEVALLHKQIDELIASL